VLIAASIAESKHIGSRSWGDADDRVKEESTKPAHG
jgi:hypothetical protein